VKNWLPYLGSDELSHSICHRANTANCRAPPSPRAPVLRGYPISAHLRFYLETMRPEMRQYFFEGEKDGAPFSRDKRALVYQRAKMVLDKRPFRDPIRRAAGGHF
jgi:hypothetical protein